ncbi:MAG: beta-ketoacyl synthase N-terminal-like domain-containing protein, partial [Planctomycetota bacterium]
MERRVVVTGLGVITPIGSGKDKFWKALLDGKSGVGEVTCFDTSGHKVHRGAEVRDFNPRDYIKNGTVDQLGKGSQMAIAA